MRYGAWENKPRPASWKTESHAAPVSTAWERSRADPTPRPTATASMKTRARRADAAGAAAAAAAAGDPARGPAVRQVDIRVAACWKTRYAPSAARGRRRRGRRPWRPPRCCGERSCRSEPRRGRGAQSCRSERGRPWFPVCAVRMRNRDRARAAETLATPCTVGAGALIRARCSVRGRRSRGGSRFKPSTGRIGTGKQLERVRDFAIFSPRSREPRR